MARLTLALSLTILWCAAFAQSPLARLTSLHDSLRAKLQVEKIYLQTDRPNYSVGDTIRLKAYAFNADYLNASSKSGLIYLELVNDSAEIVHRSMLPLADGVGAGQIAVDGKDVPEGSYTLRAYTSWMRNFGDSYFFNKKLYITGAATKPWLVSVQTTTSSNAGKQNIIAQLMLTDGSGRILPLQDVQIKAQDGNHTFTKGKAQTGLDGSLNVNFDLPAKANINNLSLAIDGDSRHINVPLVLNRLENLDLQFMPEGGTLLAGVRTKIGFKAIGEDGLGKDVSGTIYDNAGVEVGRFRSSFKGMGSFMFVPQAGVAYTAKVNGSPKTYNLPGVKTHGTALHITETPDSLTIGINTTADIYGTYYVIAQSRNKICQARSVIFKDAGEKSIVIAKDLFPTGIARISLLNRLGQPLNERQVFIDHGDNLKIRVDYPKTFAARDSVPLSILVTDKNDNPVQGSFSLSVTDDEQVPLDSLRLNRLTTQLLLTSDLKGNIEQPDYYLLNKPCNREALDNLLLTQGWTGYTWPQVTAADTAKLTWPAEPEFTVSGNVTNFWNKPVKGSRITLINKKPFFAKNETTDAKGNFTMKDFPVLDSVLYFVEATNKRGKNDGIGIVVNQSPAAEVSKTTTHYLPWFVNIDTLLHRSVTQAIDQRLEEEKLSGKHVLKDVVIKEKKRIPGSHNLNEDGGADQVLDEKDMVKAGDMTLEEILQKKVKGFTVRTFLGGTKQYYFIGDFYYMVLYIDGINTKTWGLYATTKYYLENLTAKDIKGIEVMHSVPFAFAYDHDILLKRASPHPSPMFLEVTTKANLGLMVKRSPGTYVYRPVPFNINKEFYRPKYTVKTPTTTIKDYRATVHWEPNIITDKNGRATVSFYASDRPAHYTAIVEGSDMQGNIGSNIYHMSGGKGVN